ncbi:hypothetical protein Taro_012622 [Colocasia esculenta]|uniref:Uncharacterized protein n=1 Tax=Colocasia esculenta TaxID=4460 RepID=A0A843U9K8_COLES|nr:hypothetical protein [Colocasia esculenta]
MGLWRIDQMIMHGDEATLDQLLYLIFEDVAVLDGVPQHTVVETVVRLIHFICFTWSSQSRKLKLEYDVLIRCCSVDGGGLSSAFLLGALATAIFFPLLCGEKSTVLTSLPAAPSLLGLLFGGACIELSAKNISISATTELSWSKPLIFVPSSFSLTWAARPLRHMVIASSCVGGLSHLMLKSRHRLMKLSSVSPFLCLREHSSASDTFLSAVWKRSMNFFWRSAQSTMELGLNLEYYWKAVLIWRALSVELLQLWRLGAVRWQLLELVVDRIYSGGPLASLGEAVVHDLFDHSPLGHDIFGRGGLGVYAPARLLDRIDGVVINHGRAWIDIGQVALLMSCPSILDCRWHLAAWRICSCLLPSLRQEVDHFSLPALYEIILGVFRHCLEGGSGWRHEEHFGLVPVSRQLLISEMEAGNFVFFPSFEVQLDLPREGPLVMLEWRLENLPQVQGSSLTALLPLGRSSGRVLGIPGNDFVLLAGFIYPECPERDAGWPSRFSSRSVADVRCTLRVLGLWVFGRSAAPSLLKTEVLSLSKTETLGAEASARLASPSSAGSAWVETKLGFRLPTWSPTFASFCEAAGAPSLMPAPVGLLLGSPGSEFVGGCHHGDASVPGQHRLASIEPDADVSHEHGLAGVVDDRVGLVASLALSPFSRDCDARDGIHREDSALAWAGIDAPGCSSFWRRLRSSLDRGDHP